LILVANTSTQFTMVLIRPYHYKHWYGLNCDPFFFRHTGVVVYGREYYYGGLGIEYSLPVSVLPLLLEGVDSETKSAATDSPYL